MTNTHIEAYVIWRKRRYDDRPNAVSGPFAESKFLSLHFLALYARLCRPYCLINKCRYFPALYADSPALSAYVSVSGQERRSCNTRMISI